MLFLQVFGLGCSPVALASSFRFVDERSQRECVCTICAVIFFMFLGNSRGKAWEKKADSELWDGPLEMNHGSTVALLIVGHLIEDEEIHVDGCLFLHFWELKLETIMLTFWHSPPFMHGSSDAIMHGMAIKPPLLDPAGYAENSNSHVSLPI
jgi:hypothetical protein